MFDYKITCDNGASCIIRASDRRTAIRMFCEAEGCSREFVDEHCTVRKVKEGVKNETARRIRKRG